MKSLVVGGVDEAFNLPWKNVALKNPAPGFTWADFAGGTGQLMRALNTGEIDVAVVLTEGAVLDIIRNDESRIFSAYVESPLEWGIHVSEKSGILNMDALPQHTIAVSKFGSGSHLIPLVMAHELGWPAHSFDFHESTSMEQALQDLESGVADIFFWERYTTEPHTHNRAVKRVGSYFSKWPSFCIAIRKQEYKNIHLGLKEILNDVLAEAGVFKANKVSLKEIEKYYGMKRESAASWMNAARWRSTQGIDHEAIEAVVRSMRQCGLVERNVSWKEVVCA